MQITDPIELVRRCLENEGKVALLEGKGVRVYNRHGVTVATIDLDLQPDRVQETIIDMIMPHI